MFRAAQIFREILGDKLLTQSLEDLPPDAHLPTVEKLWGKILIKHKKLKNPQAVVGGGEKESTLASTEMAETGGAAKSMLQKRASLASQTSENQSGEQIFSEVAIMNLHNAL